MMLREANDVVGPGRGARGRLATAAAMTTAGINEFLFHFRPLLSRSDVVSIDVRHKTTCGKRTGDLISQSLETTTVASVTDQYRVRSQSSTGQDIYTWWQSGIGLDAFVAAFLPGDSGSAVVATADNMVVGLLANIGSITIRASPL